MFHVYTDRKDFDLGIVDHGLSEGQDISVYVLDEEMSALSLMKAFRACRYNPLRTYYYVPKTESEFYKYAIESISRGTVNIFSELDELREALQGEADAWRSYSIPECITKSAANFKIFANRETLTPLSVAVTAALHKNSCYTVVSALLPVFGAGGPLRVPQFQENIQTVLAEDEKARKANEEFQKSHSQFLSVLVAGGKQADEAWNTEEYNEMALHVMFQPFVPKGRGIAGRVDIITQILNEKKA